MSFREIVTLFIVVAALASGCNNDHPKSIVSPANTQAESAKTAFGTLNIKVSFLNTTGSTAAKLAAVESIDKITAYVYDEEDSLLVSQKLGISNNRYTGRIIVAAHENLRLVLAFFDGDIVRYLGEDSEIDVPADGEATAEVIANYMGLNILSPKTALAGEAYTVSWRVKDYAHSYQVEESDTPDFIKKSIVFDDDNYFTDITHTEEGLHYYRVRVLTAYGYGPWHSTGVSSTEILKNEGGIVVDGNIPGDEPSVVSIDFEDGSLANWSVRTNTAGSGSCSIVKGGLTGTGVNMLRCIASSASEEDVKALSIDYSPSVNWSGYSISFDFSVSGTTSSGELMLYIYDDTPEEKGNWLWPNQGYRINIGSMGIIQLMKGYNGTASALSSGEGSIEPGISYHVEIEARQGTIKIYLDNELIIDEFDDRIGGIFTSGSFSFILNNFAATPFTANIDNIVVSDITSSSDLIDIRDSTK